MYGNLNIFIATGIISYITHYVLHKITKMYNSS